MRQFKLKNQKKPGIILHKNKLLKNTFKEALQYIFNVLFALYTENTIPTTVYKCNVYSKLFSRSFLLLHLS